MKKYVITLSLCGIMVYTLSILFPIEKPEYKSNLVKNNIIIDDRDSVGEVNSITNEETKNNNIISTVEIASKDKEINEKVVGEIAPINSEETLIVESKDEVIEVENNDEVINKKENTITNEEKVIVDNRTNNVINIDNNVVIIDKSNNSMCLQAIDYFYEDTNYKYYFNCMKSNNIYIVIGNSQYKLKEALEKEIITIKQLEDQGYHFNKTSKNLQIM